LEQRRFAHAKQGTQGIEAPTISAHQELLDQLNLIEKQLGIQQVDPSNVVALTSFVLNRSRIGIQ